MYTDRTSGNLTDRSSGMYTDRGFETFYTIGEGEQPYTIEEGNEEEYMEEEHQEHYEGGEQYQSLPSEQVAAPPNYSHPTVNKPKKQQRTWRPLPKTPMPRPLPKGPRPEPKGPRPESEGAKPKKMGDNAPVVEKVSPYVISAVKPVALSENSEAPDSSTESAAKIEKPPKSETVEKNYFQVQ